MPDIEEKISQLAKIIKRNNAVLVIGPYAYLVATKDGEKSIFQLLSEKLIAEVPDLQGLADAKDFHLLASEYVNRKSDFDLELLVSDFYEEFNAPIPLLEALAKLPFSLVINCTPDKLLLKAFQRVGKLHTQYSYYHYSKQNQNITLEGSVDKPLIFNLLGDIEDTNCLVLTHEEQLDFVKNIISKDAGLPKSLISTLQEKTHYIFVGFDFEYWYLRLMFQVLNINKDKKKNQAFGFHQNDNNAMKLPTKLFFSNEYNIEFLDDAPEVFLQTLNKKINGIKPTPIDNTKHKILVLYHQKDEAMFEQFKTSASPMLQRNNVEIIDNQEFVSGETEQIVLQNLRNAPLILPLLSSQFLADAALMNYLKLATDEKNKKVVPILLKPCSFDIIEEIHQFHSVLPSKDTFVSQQNNQESSYLDICNHIELLLKSNIL
jgi:hypothetical protein